MRGILSLLNSRAFSLFWTLTVLVVVTYTANCASRGIQTNSDLLALLPRDSAFPAREETSRYFMRRVSQRIGILLRAADLSRAMRAADAIASRLSQSAAFESVQGKIDFDVAQSYHDLLFPRRELLYSTAFEQDLQGAEVSRALLNRVKRILYSPLSGTLSASLPEDPLLIYADILGNLPKPPGQLSLQDGYLISEVEGSKVILISAALSQSVFNRSAQRLATQTLENLKREASTEFPDVTLEVLGALQFAEAMASEAEKDVNLITIGSVLGTTLLFLLVYYSLIPLLFALLSIGVGLLVALAASLFVFGHVHLLTLGLGASLIGVCADYSFQNFCNRLASPGQSCRRVLERVLPAISLGALTSVLGFAGLLFVPFPGLQEISLFCIAGMLGSYCSEVAWFPLLPPSTARPSTPRSLEIAERWFALCRSASIRRNLGILALILSPLVLFYTLKSFPDDDVRGLQKPPHELALRQARFQAVLGTIDSGRFFAVIGATPEKLLERQDLLLQNLDALKRKGALQGYRSFGTFVPSPYTQLRRYRLLRSVVLEHAEQLSAGLVNIGLPPTHFETYLERLRSEPAAILTLDQWLTNLASLGLKDLWLGKIGDEYSALVTIEGLNDERALSELERKIPGAYFLDQAAQTSALLGKYRRTAGALIALCYLLVYGTLVWRYGLRVGSQAMLPALAAFAIATAVQSAAGQPLTVFSVLGNLIVLGLAIDYSIFVIDGTSRAAPTMLAIALSAMTTILSFGLLAISNTPILAAFGLTLFVGVMVAMLTAPLVVPPTLRFPPLNQRLD